MYTQADKHTQKKSKSHGWAIYGGTATFRKCGSQASEQFNDTPASHFLLSQELPPLSGLSADTYTHAHTHKVICFSRGAVTEQLQVKGATSTLHHTKQSTPWPVLHWPANPEVSNEVLLLLIMHTSRCCTFPSFSLTLSLSPLSLFHSLLFQMEHL